MLTTNGPANFVTIMLFGLIGIFLVRVVWPLVWAAVCDAWLRLGVQVTLAQADMAELLAERAEAAKAVRR